MTLRALIAGGGIGGLAAALALRRVGCGVDLYEQSTQWGETGAGIQLGPNATALLHRWGLQAELERVAAEPARLVVRRAGDAAQLAVLPLGAAMRERYGAPYLTVHRADLHALLLQGAASAGAGLHLAERIGSFDQTPDAAVLRLGDGRPVEGDLLVAADGVWSPLRHQLLGDAAARPTGHTAYRALLSQEALPPPLRSQEVAVWLGPRSHVVAYPVRHGHGLNLVAIVEGGGDMAASGWNAPGEGAALLAALGPVCGELQALVEAPTQWSRWSLHDRPAVASPAQMARGRVALLGDAAHPMRPYLAQGAAMALEDAHALARAMDGAGPAGQPVDVALRRYAQARWQRVARVQRRAVRNGRVFHATGLVRWGRDLSLAALGPKLLDTPWLYRPQPG